MTDTTIHHAASWFEIPVSNLARSQAFYETLLGITLTPMTCSGETLAVFPGDERHGVRGALLAADQVAPQRTGVTLYLNAGNTLAPVLARAVQQGSEVLTPRTVLPDGGGCFAHITDPDGQRIGLYALD